MNSTALEADWVERFVAGSLVCPLHRLALSKRSDQLSCARGCNYPIIEGVPFLLPRDVRQTHAGISGKSFALLEQIRGASRGLDMERRQPVDAAVQQLVAATNSILYIPLIGKLRDYPIPVLPMQPPRPGSLLLDIGCGWGRWSFAAARAGFSPVGIDPSLESALAARRVARDLKISALFVVGDSRYLPFATTTFDAAFSYSVLQHFSKDDVTATLRSLKAVMKPNGMTKLHMLNRYGLRSLQVQLSRGFRDAENFETRYWTPRELLDRFSETLGPSLLEIDGFFVQGRYEDRHLFRARHRAIVEVSQFLKRAATVLPLLRNAADNLFVVSQMSNAEPSARCRDRHGTGEDR